MRSLLLCLMLACVVGCDKPKGKTARELNTDLSPDFPENTYVDKADLGVDLYPGSVPPKGLPPIMRASIDGATVGKPGLRLATTECWRETPDSPQKVGEFYKSNLSQATVVGTATGVTVDGVNLVGEKVRVLATRKTGATTTAIVITVTKKVAGS